MDTKLKPKWKYICLFLFFLLIILFSVSIILTKPKNRNYWAYNIGNTISFGVFEQDNNAQNGKESIDWIIIDENNGKVLVLSKKCLYACSNKNSNSGWKTSALREWLNNSFYKNSFSNYEKNLILKTPSICYGKELHDKIFILSNEELKKYAHIEYVRETIPTQYVLDNFKDNLKFAAENYETWLRNENDYGYVKGYDEIYYGTYTDGISNEEIAAVRPAMWIDISEIK